MLDKIYDMIAKGDIRRFDTIENEMWHNYVDELKAKLDEAIETIKDFADHGTRHDTNPTGQFRDCGCFDSFAGDNWQNYIYSI